MVIAVTGGTGFLGWHVRARASALGIETTVIDRNDFADEEALDTKVKAADAIIHLAGVNRAEDDSVIAEQNPWLANRLVESLKRTDRAVPIVYANSTHSEGASVFGIAKQEASDVLARHQEEAGAAYLDLVIPHVFGEYGTPFYNSGVTTFAYQLARGETAEVNRGGQLELIHAQDVTDVALDACANPRSERQRLSGRPTSVGDAWDLLESQHRRYVDEKTVPAFADLFELRMFNMLRSQLYLNGHYPQAITLHEDARGAFSELARADGVGQTSISTSVPGITRGDHFHFDKIERFVVVGGSARIRLRQVLTDDIQVYDVSGDAPTFIDMPPLCTHNITNTGADVMTTVFWAGDHFDPNNPDTYVDPVEPVPSPS